MKDWTDRRFVGLVNNNKARQTPHTEDRTIMYKDYRRRFSQGCYVTDIDHVEYRIVDGNIVAVGVLELTRYDRDDVPHRNYLKAIEDRYNIRDKQGDVARFCAKKLGCRAWIVLFRHTIDIFWIYDLTALFGWWQLEQAQYTYWIENNCSVSILSDIGIGNSV